MKKLKITVTVEYELDTFEDINYQQISSDVVSQINKNLSSLNENKEVPESINNKEHLKKSEAPQRVAKNQVNNKEKTQRKLKVKNAAKNKKINSTGIIPDINTPAIGGVYTRSKVLPRIIKDLEDDLEPFKPDTFHAVLNKDKILSIYRNVLRGTTLFDTS